MRRTLFAIACALAFPPALLAGQCDGCGCDAACRKVCRPVCKPKKVTVTCWDCRCEPFCVPGPGKSCESCGCCDDRAACAHVHVRKKLMKKEIQKEIMVTEWVVEDLCPECQSRSKTNRTETASFNDYAAPGSRNKSPRERLLE